MSIFALVLWPFLVDFLRSLQPCHKFLTALFARLCFGPVADCRLSTNSFVGCILMRLNSWVKYVVCRSEKVFHIAYG